MHNECAASNKLTKIISNKAVNDFKKLIGLVILTEINNKLIVTLDYNKASITNGLRELLLSRFSVNSSATRHN